jgi:hypothetical protein
VEAVPSLPLRQPLATGLDLVDPTHPDAILAPPAAITAAPPGKLQLMTDGGRQDRPEFRNATRAEREHHGFRARLLKEDGSFDDITHDDKLTVSSEFLDSWQRSTDTPRESRASCWQGVADDHPLGSGKPAYRVVYKTLRIIPFPNVEMKWPNLVVTIANGDVKRGSMNIPRTIPGRSPPRYVLPEYGRVNQIDDRSASYMSCPDKHVYIGSQEDTLNAANFVEIIWHAEDVNLDDYDAVVARGRRAVGPMKTMLD